MGWKRMDVREQRVAFAVAAVRGEKAMSAFCGEFGMSRPTGYLWLKRYREAGIGGIAERSRRPRSMPAQTAWEKEEQVIALRLRYPDWGARKLQVLLVREGVTLTVSTVHRILLRYDLVREQDRHGQATGRFERERPNQLWQMDFKGPRHWPGTVGPLSVLDDHSRYAIALEPVASTHAGPVREHLEKAFATSGMPDEMLMDHGTPWWSHYSPGGRTQLALWLMRQGIALHHGRIRHPQTQGKVERFHGSLARALEQRGPNPEEQVAWLERFRWEYNHVRPHQALGMKTPASVWTRSERKYDPSQPPWVYPEGSRTLKIDSQGTVDISGQRWRVGRGLKGERVRIEQVEQRFLVFYCSTLIREIDLVTQRSTMVERWITNPKLTPQV
jgi:transposase InsO family protein